MAATAYGQKHIDRRPVRFAEALAEYRPESPMLRFEFRRIHRLLRLRDFLAKLHGELSRKIIMPRGRPISNFSNCLNKKTWGLLQAAARIMATPRITFEELISEGWFTITRYKDNPSYMWYDLKREMCKYIAKEENRHEIIKGDRISLRNVHDFEQFLKHRKYKLCR